MNERTPKDSAASPANAATPFEPSVRRADRWLNRAIVASALAVLGVLLYLGVSYYQDARLADTQSPAARAVSNLRNIVTASPNNAMARVRLAEAMMANGQQREAVDQLGEALKIDKELVPAMTDLGLIAMEQREWKKAEEYWGSVIELLKRNPMSGQDQRLADSYYYLGTTLVELKRYEEAVADLKESVRIKRDAAPVHYMLSVAYQRLGLPDQQKRELEIVVAFDPQNAQANYDLGLLMLTAGDAAGAAELFRIAADRAPDGITDPQKQLDALGDAATHLAAARRYTSSDPKKALAEARIAAAIDPADPELVRLIAQLWEKTGDVKRAQNAWERLLELVPGDKQATDEIKRLNPDAK
jgi:tetratricopeptide (TPR) repeat protein